MNALYDVAASAMVAGGFNWLSDDLMLVAWSGTPTFDPSDKTLADVKQHPGVAELGSSLPIVGRAVTAEGIAQTDVVLIPGIPAGQMVTWLTMCRRQGAHDASEMILFIDEVEGLPYDPNGLDFVVTPDWAQGRGWFRPGQ